MAGSMLLRGDDYFEGLLHDEYPGQIPSAAREVFEIVCVLEGGAEYWIEDQFYKLKAGDVLIIPVDVMVSANLKQKGCPFIRHSVWISRRFMTFLKLQDEKADYAFDIAHKQGKYLLKPPKEIHEDIAGKFIEISKEFEENAFNAELTAKALISYIIVQINKLAAQAMLIGGFENRLAPVLNCIHQQCTEAVTVEGLATKFSYSPSHLAHSFKKQMGTSLYHYVLLRRLQIGREAMLNGVPVKEAYQKCGFGDYAGFYRAFIKEFGMSPQQYKKKNT